jgi:hypothetical protein
MMKDSLAGVSASLEAPTMVSTGGNSPVMAIIEQLDATRCRMRSVNSFAVGAILEFNAVIYGASPVPLRGTVVSRAQQGPRFTYVVALDTASAHAATAIDRAVDVARSRSHRGTTEVKTTNGLTRSSVRVPVDIALRYTTPDGRSHDGRATNLSTGGMLMNSSELLDVGVSIELHFLLEDAAVSIQGRIVAHQESTPHYNIAFFDVRDLVKRALTEFVNARVDK